MYLGKLDKVDQFSVSKYFTRPCQVINTEGQGVGVIVKFSDFYLKIYPVRGSCTLSIQQYAYGASEPFQVDEISHNHMKAWAHAFEQNFT